MRAKNETIAVLGAFLLLEAFVARAAVPLTRAIDATVLIKVERSYRNQSLPSSGSGFFVDAQGHVLTNWHVVAPQIQLAVDGRDAEVATTIGTISVVVNSGRADETTLVARVIRADRTRDLALLAVPFTSRSWLDVSAPPEVALTQGVVAIGYPFGELLALNKKNPEVTVTKGHVTSIRHDDRGGVEAFQLDAAVNPGNSGGPVLNEEGSVVGVAWAGVTGGTGTALAIAPGRVRAFSDEVQFDVSVTPPVIYERRQPLLVEVRPLLRSVGGLRGTVRLEGANIEPVSQELTTREGSLTCQVAVPGTSGQAGQSGSYNLTVRLADAAGREVFRHVWAVPVREGQSGDLAGARPAADVLRDRRDFPNQASSRDTTWTAGKGAEAPANQTAGRPPLSQLASGIKLRGAGDEKGIVISNSNLNNVGFVINETRYAALPTELRALAIEFDRAEFHLRGLTAAITYGTDSFVGDDAAPAGSPVSPGTRAIGQARTAASAERAQAEATARRAEAARARASDESYRVGVSQDIGTARATLEATRAKVVAAKLCRCPDNTWFRSADRASCERCIAP